MSARVRLVCALVLFALPSLRAKDWPQWGGRDARNFIADDRRLPERFRPEHTIVTNGVQSVEPGKNLKWTAPLGTQSYVTPAIAKGRVYIGGNDAKVDASRFRRTKGSVFDCLDEATGHRLWRLVIPRLKTKNKLFNFDDLDLGLCSSPTVDGDRVYIMGSRGDVLCLDVHGQADGNAGPFTDEGRYMVDTRTFPDKPGRFEPALAPAAPAPIALTPEDADIVWRYDLLETLDVWPQDAVDCSMLVYGDCLYVCVCNGVDRSHRNIPSPNAPNLIVLDKHTGALLATIDKPLGTSVFHGDWSSPSLARVKGRDLLFWGGGDGLCYAFDPRFEPGEDGSPGKLKRVWQFDCNPACNRYRNGLRLPYSKNGEGPSEIIATPVFANNRIYVAVGQDSRHGPGKGCFSCIDATRTGDVTESGKVWQCLDVGRSFSSAAVTKDGLVFIADYAGILRCLDADTGREYWSHDLKGRVFCSPFCAGGCVYIGTEAGRLTVAEAKKEKRIVDEIRFDGPIYATPVAANGVLYIATQRTLYAFQRD